MKKIVFILTLMLSAFTTVFAQLTVKPTFDKEVVCQVTTLDDEGAIYDNVIVKMKCTVKFASSTCQTRVTICNQNGKKIAKKIYPDALLYVFDSGQIQVGKNGFTKMLIYKEKDGTTVGKIRVNEGVQL